MALTKTSFNQLPSNKNPNFQYLNNEGNLITKAQLVDYDGNGYIKLTDSCDERIRTVFEDHGTDVIEIIDYKPDLSIISEYSFVSKNGITSNRNVNYSNYYDQITADVKVGNDKFFTGYIIEQGIDPSEVTTGTIKEIMTGNNLTFHKAIDNKVYVVNTDTHSLISHSGGVAQASNS